MAMTTVTRSTRRTESHHVVRPPSLPAAPQAQVAAHARRNLLAHNSNSPRTKRHLETSDLDFDALKPKKARITAIAVDIPARTAPRSRVTTESDAKSDPAAHPSRPAVVGPVPNPSSPYQHATATQAATTRANPTEASTKQQGKVASSLKHELNNLQPNQETSKESGRKLRSQEATRFKSELSAYFPEYDEVIGNDPKEYHIFNVDTPIIITDSNPDPGRKPTLAGADSSSGDAGSQQSRSRVASSVRCYSDTLFDDLFDSQTIDFSFLEARDKGKSLKDTLPDSIFEPAHKRAERLERSIRNTEKGRAQHEKDQIIRLLDGLQSHDWLRVMGVSGITESKKRAFEPAREHFIKGCHSILDKFRKWATEEKRRKLQKGRAYAEVEAAKDEDDEPDEGSESASRSEHVPSSEEADEDGGSLQGTGEPRNSTDVDAFAARQLREEAMAAAKASRRGRAAKQAAKPAPEPAPYKAFTSFFEKKHLRDAALSGTRRRGRSVLAWGHVVTDPPEREFELPDEFLDEDNLKAHARRKRRENRGRH